MGKSSFREGSLYGRCWNTEGKQRPDGGRERAVWETDAEETAVGMSAGCRCERRIAGLHSRSRGTLCTPPLAHVTAKLGSKT